MATELVDAAFRKYGPAYRWYATVTMMLGTFSMVLATTVVNVAIPDIMAAFALNQDTVQWLSTGFLAAMSATMLTTTWCVRRFGQRVTYITALIVFVAAAIAGGLASRADLLIASRVLQGASAGIIQPLAMITIFSVFPVEQRGRAMGLYGLGVVLAPAVGPAVGGWLVDHLSWRALFFLPTPFCLTGLALAPRFIVGRQPTDERPAFDWGGLVFLVVFTACLLYAFNLSHRAGWFAWQTIALLAVAGAASAAFVWWERGRSHAMLDLGVFDSPQFAAASVVAFAYGLSLYGTTYLVPLLVQTVARYSPSHAGALLLPAGLALAMTVPLAGWLTDQVPARRLIVSGLVLFCLSSLLFVRFEPDTGFWLLAGWLVIGRVGLGLIIPALNARAMHGLSAEHVGQGSSAINFIRQLGGAFGVNLLATFLEWRTLVHERAAGLAEAGMLLSPQRVAAFHESFLVVAAVSLVAILPAWRMALDRR